MSDFEKLASIRAVYMDVDGVLTDGTFIWSASGDESKGFSFEDVMGLSLARKAGISLGLISGEDSDLIDRFALKASITNVAKGCKAKDIALRRFAENDGVPLPCTAFIGDDVNDLPAFAVAGMGVAPSNAQPIVKSAAAVVLDRRGGHGAVRQFIEMILAAKKTSASQQRSL